MKKLLRSPYLYLVVTVALILILTMLGPEERSLGSNVRLVYLHGAWVLSAEASFILAGVAGALFVISKLIKHDHPKAAKISFAFGITGIIYWVTYLPLSLMAMEANWNGLFLAEPRFALALTFAVVGVLLQAGIWLINSPMLTSIANLAFIITLRVVFANAANIMHPPPSPIFNSGNYALIAYFVGLMGLTFISAVVVFFIVYKTKA